MKRRFNIVKRESSIHFTEPVLWILISNMAGLNRALIRDEITSIKQTEGITGIIRMDGSWNNVTPVFIAEFRDGKFHYRQFEWSPVFADE